MATIKDVAREAGVSISTVSRVVNKNYPVHKETRKRVEAVIKRLNFTPNSMARGLIQKKSATVGLIVPGLTNMFFSQVIHGADQYFKEKDFHVFLCDTLGDREAEKEYVYSLLQRQVEGIVVVDPDTSLIRDGFYERITSRVPVVLVNGYHHGIRCNFVLSDQQLGFNQAMSEFLEHGHRKIAFVRGQDSYSYDLRESFFRQWHQVNRVSMIRGSVFSIQAGNSVQTVEMARECGIELFRDYPEFTAVMAGNDLIAAGLLNAARELNLNVPEDRSIIGFDNLMLSEMCMPKLTTVDLKMEQLGSSAAELIFDLLKNDPKTCRKVFLDTDLVVRDSVHNESKKVD